MRELTVAEWLEDAAIEAAALYCSRASVIESLWPAESPSDDNRGAAASMLTLANTSMRLRSAVQVGP